MHTRRRRVGKVAVLATAFAVLFGCKARDGGSSLKSSPADVAAMFAKLPSRNFRTYKVKHWGDPINVAVAGTEAELKAIFFLAGWVPPDPITVKSSLHIAWSVAAGRSYPTAPVSNLYLQGRTQDGAFEQQINGSASTRHHVRFWRSDTLQIGGLPVWLGSATLDASSGISGTGWHFTHHISRLVDAERDLIATDLVATDQVERTFSVPGIGPLVGAANGEGDPFDTDGDVRVIVLKHGSGDSDSAPAAAKGAALTEAGTAAGPVISDEAMTKVINGCGAEIYQRLQDKLSAACPEFTHSVDAATDTVP